MALICRFYSFSSPNKKKEIITEKKTLLLDMVRYGTQSILVNSMMIIKSTKLSQCNHPIFTRVIREYILTIWMQKLAIYVIGHIGFLLVPTLENIVQIKNNSEISN